MGIVSAASFVSLLHSTYTYLKNNPFVWLKHLILVPLTLIIGVGFSIIISIFLLPLLLETPFYAAWPWFLLFLLIVLHLIIQNFTAALYYKSVNVNLLKPISIYISKIYISWLILFTIYTLTFLFYSHIDHGLLSFVKQSATAYVVYKILLEFMKLFFLPVLIYKEGQGDLGNLNLPSIHLKYVFQLFLYYLALICIVIALCCLLMPSFPVTMEVWVVLGVISLVAPFWNFMICVYYDDYVSHQANIFYKPWAFNLSKIILLILITFTCLASWMYFIGPIFNTTRIISSFEQRLKAK